MALTSERCFVSICFWPTSWILLKQLFLSPSWALSQYPIRPSASWAIDSEPIRARGIIVNYHGFDRNRWPKNKNPRLRDLAAKNSRIRDAKKHKKLRFRDSYKTPPRFRNWKNHFRDPEFSGYHSPPLQMVVQIRRWQPCVRKKGTNVDEFHSHLNSINTNIKSTIEIEWERSIAFLDKKNNQTRRWLDHCVCLQESYPHRPLPWFQITPPSPT